MKFKKRILSMIFTVMVAFGMSMSAFAAAGGMIAVENPQPGQTYTAYKIFSVIYNYDRSSYSYTISGDSEWFDVVSGYGGITLEKNPDEDVYTVIKNDSFSAPEFANVLKASSEGKNGTELQPDGEMVRTTVPLGYYFVNSTTGVLCNLTTLDPNSIIRDKNEFVFEKTDDDESVEVGQTVNYTITGKVPETTGFETYTYKITDTMSDGLTFNKDVKVYIDGTETNSNFTLTNHTDGTGFALIIDVMALKEQSGAAIEVKYSANVNENAIGQVENNQAYLEFSNDPVNSTVTTTTPADQEIVYSSRIVVDKYQADQEERKLEGAKFILMNREGLFYQWDKTNKKVFWVENQGDATVQMTDDQGIAEFGGLEDGTYQLKEIMAPAGYNLMTEPVEVVISGQTATIENPTVLTQEVDVPNSAGTQLPETGGTGTTVFYAAGGALAVGAAVLLLRKRKSDAASSD